MGLNRISISKVMVVWIGQEVSCSISSVSIYCGPESDIRGKFYDHLNFPRTSSIKFGASRYIMGLNRTSMLKFMVVWIGPELPCSISSVSIYCGPESDIRVKCYDQLNFPRTLVFHFRASWYIMGLNRTPVSKVMVVWIRLELLCSISSVSINYVPESDIRVKSYDHLNFLRTSIFQVQVPLYIMGLNRISISKVMVVWIGQELSCSISSVSIYCGPESDIRVKFYDHLNFPRTSVIKFGASRYLMGLNRTSMLKVMAIWIGPELPCSISSVPIYYGPESDIRVKCYDHLNFPRTSVIKFRASRYIIGLSRTSMLKIMAVWIGPELPCSITSVSMYYVAESDIRVKCYDHWNFSRFFVIQFRVTWYIMGLNRTPMSKVIVVWIGQELLCSISSVSITYVPESDIRVKSYDHLNFSRTSIFQFQVPLYIMGLNRISISKVMVVWIGQELSCSISSVSIYCGPESDIRVKFYDHLNFPRTSSIKFGASRYIMGLNRTSMWKVMAV